MASNVNLTAILSRLPIPVIYTATAALATEIATYLPLVPASIDGYSTVAVVSGATFVVGALKWIHSELLIIYPTLGGQPLTVSPPVVTGSNPTAAPAVTAPVLPALPTGFDLAVAKDSGFTVYENAAGNVILSSPNTNWKGQAITTWSDINGNIIPTAPSLVGYTQL